MSIVITGANGQLGKEIQRLLYERNIDFHAAGREELDITNKEATFLYINKLLPSFVLHCAAFTNVEKAEEEEIEKNKLINVEGTRNVAQAAEAVGATMVYVSTDYVFDGEYEGEYSVEHRTHPINEYGKAKLLGENLVQEICSQYYVVRTSWVFGEFGSNFVYSMKRLAKEKEKLMVVNDQLGRPTWTRTLAEFLLYITEKNPPIGIYHLSNDGSCTWYEFAKKILEDENVEVVPVNSSQFPQKAKRPKHSVLDLSKTKKLGFEIPTWENALQTFLKK